MTTEQHSTLHEITRVRALLVECPSLEAENPALREKYNNARIDAEQILPSKFTVNRATPAEKKAYPVRWLIVLVTALTAFSISLIILLTLENFRQFKYLKP